MKKIFINSEDFDTSVAIAEDGRLCNFFIEKKVYAKAGNIYKGKIEKLVAGMNFVFVDIGDSKPAFLSEREYFDSSNIAESGMLEDVSEAAVIKPQESITGIFEKGQEILVQVIKEPYQTKGARLTTNLMLPGYYVVYSPYLKQTGVSRRISDEGERDRLKTIIADAKNNIPGDYGIIARTQAEGADAAALQEEIRGLHEKWKAVKKAADSSRAPSQIYCEQNLPVKIVREYLDSNTSSIVTDSREIYEEMEKYLKTAYNRTVDLNLYEGNDPLFEYYNLQGQVEGIFSNIVSFKKGGYIKIDLTEALTVFDINSGKFKGAEDVEASLLAVNLHAAREIARQIILRNLGGLIVIDFIDMQSEENRKKVKEVMEQELAKSKMFHKVGNISEFGLMELTRKRDSRRVEDIYFEECPKCNGHGRILTDENICIKYMRKIKYECKKMLEENVAVLVPEKIKEKLQNEYIETLHEYEIKYKKNIILKTEG
jgi:ribonuclease G